MITLPSFGVLLIAVAAVVAAAIGMLFALVEARAEHGRTDAVDIGGVAVALDDDAERAA